MAQIGIVAARKTALILQAQSGLPFSVAAVSQREGRDLAEISAEQIVTQNVAAEVAERTAAMRYPRVHVYCERVVNELREKFRTFSGRAYVTVEVRMSQDRLDELEDALQLYVDAVTQILDANRGDWGDGMLYGGGYEVTIGATKHGGKNFLQAAKVQFEVAASLK